MKSYETVVEAHICKISRGCMRVFGRLQTYLIDLEVKTKLKAAEVADNYVLVW